MLKYYRLLLFSSFLTPLFLLSGCGSPEPGEGSSSNSSTSSTTSSTSSSSSSSDSVPVTGPLWSDPDTWPDGVVPGEGDEVIIDQDMEVVLDVSPPVLSGLRVQGKLSFGNNDDIELTTEWILLHGELHIGSEDAPYTRNATITLVDNVPDENIGGLGDRGIMIIGGKLNLYGDRGNAWTKLAKTAEAGSTEIEVLDASEWRVGDQIVLASTDFDMNQAEPRVITAISGNKVTLDSPLEYMHFGEITFDVDQRGEVGMLTRNIRIQASADSENTYFGGHIMSIGSGEMYASGIELYRMGQHLELGRYPIHWHLMGETQGQFIENSSIHHTFSRCVTIHGTHNVRVENNVAYDNVGHCYFLEDANETGNQLIRNLGMVTKCHPNKACNPTNSFNASTAGQNANDVLIPSDNTVSTFWFTNPDNIYRDNVAAGSEQIGIWIALPEKPTGESENAPGAENIFPRRTQLREFSGNVAHSNFDGLMFDRGPTPEGTFDLAGNGHMAFADPTNTNSQALDTVIEDFTGYKNYNNGIWGRGENHLFTGLKLADNGIGYTHAFPGLESFGGDYTSRIVDSLFVGETDNIGNPQTADEIAYGRSLPNEDPEFPIRGFEYYDSVHELENVTFRNYVDNATRSTGGISYLLFADFPISTNNSVEGLTFDNAKPVYFPEPDPSKSWAFERSNMSGYKGAVIHDKDGSMGGGANSYIVRDNGIASDDEACEIKPSWKAAVCQGDFGIASFTSFSGGSSASVTLSRNGRSMTESSHPFFSFVGKTTTVRAGSEIRVETQASSLPINLTEFDSGSWVIFELPGFSSASSGTQQNSLSALRNASGTSYYNGGGSLWVKLYAGGGGPFGGGFTVSR